MGRASLKPVRQASRRYVVSSIPYIVSGIILIILPSLLPSYLQSMMTKVLIFGILALSLNLIFGYTGLFSLGHAAYFAVGGYTAGILAVRYDIESFWISAPAGILMAALIAAILGIIALRVSGIYFLLVTFALGQLVFSVAWTWRSVTGGSDGLVGIPFPALGLPWISWNPTSFYYFVFLIFIICFFLLYRLVNSPFGHALQGIRESEPRMQSLGYNTWLYKYIAFIVAGLFAGVAGVLYAHFNGIMVPSDAGVLTSGFAMLMVIIGSTGVFFGPVIGSAVILLLAYFSSIYVPERWPLILGAAFVIAVMFLRGGISIYLVGLWRRVRYHYGSAKS